ncbi:uncharacterized protein LOC124374108, partial [Homalodisca vitripennis]|uniref:uncharacterized protein LOC124374108 n=1 Tax=Homalodisca vitripennis TaxID=197043 RepID=UPI001EEA5284
AVTVTVSLPNSEATETYYRNIHFENAPVELSIKNLGTIISDEVQEKSHDPDYISPGQSETGSTSDDEQIHVREGDGIIDNTTEEQNDNETGRSKKCRERKYGNLTRNERQAKEYRYEEFINFAKKPVPAKTFVDLPNLSRNAKRMFPLIFVTRSSKNLKTLATTMTKTCTLMQM